MATMAGFSSAETITVTGTPATFNADGGLPAYYIIKVVPRHEDDDHDGASPACPPHPICPTCPGCYPEPSTEYYSHISGVVLGAATTMTAVLVLRNGPRP